MEKYLTEIKISHSGTTEVSEDFELPDYQPEIRKTAGVQCTITKDSVYLEDGTAEVSGCVLYTVLYLSGDSELTSVPLYSTWNAKIPLPNDCPINTEDLLITAECENLTCRITGPRKLTLSARVRLRCCAIGANDCTPQTDGSNITLRQQEIPVLRMKICRHTGTAQGEIVGGKVIACRGSVQITEAVPTPAGIRVSGETVCRLLTLTEDGAYATLRSRSSISEVVPFPGQNWESTSPTVTASGKCAALTLNTAEEGRIGWEMEYDLEAILLANDTSACVIDGYCTTHEEETDFRRTDAVTGGTPIRGQISLTGEKMLRGDEAASLHFLYGWGRAIFEKGERLPSGRMLLTGTAYCTALLTGNGDIATEEVTIPLRYECDGSESAGAATECRCAIDIQDVSGHMEGNVLHLHAEAHCTGMAMEKTPLTWMRSLTHRPDHPLSPSRPAVILYTPSPEETEWDVQKRYRTENISAAEGRYVIRK